ncbi:gibberellin 20 oxidase 2-like [Silene latifolia]|uniref:gibberellin 20 oxidase 2-like n=1 Tax=Silene latifolia TaxID=37657 RepID=UPI003D78656D
MDTQTSVLTNLVTPWEYKAKKEQKSDPNLPNVPKSFIWSGDDNIGQEKPKLDAPVIDLAGFINGDESATKNAADLFKAACSNHGFFQVVNHGIDPKLLDEAYKKAGHFFRRPTSEKACCLKKRGSMWGLALAHSDRFTSNLPWKETLSFPYHANDSNNMVLNYFTSTMGTEFEQTGVVYQKYCEEMHKLSLVIMELMAISLGVDRTYYTDFFEDARSIMRMNYYPPCEEPHLVLGTGPHCDPTSLTVLFQDDVGGLEVFVDDKWQSVEPRADALVINIGDTLMAMTNGIYKSCLHRAVVNDNVERVSMAFFLCPREDKLIQPPNQISEPRKYPNFSWSDVIQFTQNHYRADTNTLQCFTKWKLDTLASNNPTTNHIAAA